MADDTRALCPVLRSVAGYGNIPTCGRQLKTDEQRTAQLCGMHLAAKKRRAANSAAWDVKSEERRAAKKRAAELVAGLAAVGVTASICTDSPVGVLLGLDAAESLLILLRDSTF